MSCYSMMCCTVELSGCSYNSKDEVLCDIEDHKKYRKYAEDKLHALVFTNDLRTILPQNGEGWEPVEYAQKEFDNAIEEIHNETFIIDRLELFLENWDKSHNEKGLAIPIPDDIYDKAWFDGDYVKTVNDEDVRDKVERMSVEVMCILYSTYKPQTMGDVEKITARKLQDFEREWFERYLPYTEEKHKIAVDESNACRKKENEAFEAIMREKLRKESEGDDD